MGEQPGYRMNEVVNCATYRDGRKVANVEIDEIREVVKAEGQFVWIGLHEPEEGLLRQVQREFGLHDLAVEDALRAHQRPKLEEYGENLFIVVRTAQMNAELELGETHFFVGPRYLVSVRHGASLPYTEVRTHCESAPNLLRHGPSFVLYALIDFIVDHFFPVLETLEEQVEELETAIFEREIDRDTTVRIFELKRRLLRLKRAVAPLIDVCSRLERFDLVLIHGEVRPYFRDVHDHAVRINERIDTMREVLSSLLEANLSLMSVNQNEVMKKLAAWAAILAAPTLLAGIWGMNFEDMPELHFELAYPVALSVMGGLCAFLYWRFHRAGWL
jgi:magnesium transporter